MQKESQSASTKSHSNGASPEVILHAVTDNDPHANIEEDPAPPDGALNQPARRRITYGMFGTVFIIL